MSDGDPRNDFVFALRDARLIDQAIAIIRMPPDRRPHVSGIIETSTARYDRQWGFHYRPRTISFPEVSTEVCDAETSYVQKHLKEVGGHFLPGNRWCPWSQHVVRDRRQTQEIAAPNPSAFASAVFRLRRVDWPISAARKGAAPII